MGLIHFLWVKAMKENHDREMAEAKSKNKSEFDLNRTLDVIDFD